VADGIAEVEVDGEIWRARGDGLAEGQAATVEGVEGATLRLAPSDRV
jgi:membrane protein implicated in regulation of membrane protease activity